MFNVGMFDQLQLTTDLVCPQLAAVGHIIVGPDITIVTYQ